MKCISDELIRRAESAGACRPAIKWLRKKRRTFDDLVCHNVSWSEWAVRNLCAIEICVRYVDRIELATVRLMRQMQTARAQLSRAILSANAAFDKGNISPQARDTAIETAWKEFYLVTEPYAQVYRDMRRGELISALGTL